MKLIALAIACALIVSCKSADEPVKSTATDTTAGTAMTPKEVALIPRAALFGNPARTGGTISPDGKMLAYLAPSNGVMNVFVAPRATPDAARALTQETTRPIRSFFFAHDNQHLVYVQDAGGNEDFHLFATDLSTGTTRDITPFPGSRANLAGLSHKVPGELLVNINDRDKSAFDLYRISLKTGKRTLVQKNDQGFGGFVANDVFEVVLAIKPRQDGGSELLRKTAKGWENFTSIDFEDAGTTGPISFYTGAQSVYMRDSRGRDTAALFDVDLATGVKTLFHEDAKADVGGTLNHPTTGLVQAVSVNYLRNEWTVFDVAIEKDIALLKARFPEFNITARTQDDSTWIVAGFASDSPPAFYIYERSSGEIKPWFETRPDLKDAPLQKMHPVVIDARDGLKLPSYYTLPRGADSNADGKPEQPMPMVLYVHGGPWARDQYGSNSTHQFYANRGYAVLSVNFRASTGFGKNFTNAGNLQWSKTMHDDLIDAVRWAEKQGIAVPGKVAIAGGSYGGYATLAGLTYTPDEFACGVDIVGPSNLNTLLASIPPYWKPGFEQMARRVGDPRTEAGKALLMAASPLTHADKIKRPLLIGQGANDPRVKQAESDQIIAAMNKHNLPVTYVLFPDEGHGFARPENSLAFNAVQEQFLASCLGGRAEPIGSAFAGSSITIPDGAKLIPGAESALAK